MSSLKTEISLQRPKIMGVLNVTPDSFSDGGHFIDPELAITRARQMRAQGADILDIGGESTRPGADIVDQETELARVIPVIEALRVANLGVDISIDTRRPDVASAAVNAGATIWNDVTALSFDEKSPSIAGDLGCQVVLMHMKGDPQTMQNKPRYDDVVAEIYDYLKGRRDTAIKAGVKSENIVLDPGIGFGKRLTDNLDLLRQFDRLFDLDCPVLIGASRKSFINKIDGSEVSERLGGSIAAALWAAQRGASIIRVHDVKETRQALTVWRAIKDSKNVKQ